VAEQLPSPESLDPGQLVVVLPHGAPSEQWLGRLLAKRAWASPAVRATALLARGYVQIGAFTDLKRREDVVWGYAPGSSSPP
jgi:hypothetical protein